MDSGSKYWDNPVVRLGLGISALALFYVVVARRTHNKTRQNMLCQSIRRALDGVMNHSGEPSPQLCREALHRLIDLEACVGGRDGMNRLMKEAYIHADGVDEESASQFINMEQTTSILRELIGPAQ